jgi:hypothetical protein
MKEILVVAIGRFFSSRSTRSAFLLSIIALGLSLAFRTATAQSPTPTPGKGHQPCTVCHNVQHNPHTITIDCNALQAHLAHGDYEGPCRPTPTPTPKHTPTPKPTPTPKHTPTPKPTPTPKHTPTPKPTPTPHKEKCEVCHNPHNPHTIKIPCDQVDKFLSHHPGDYRGPCHVTEVTNP